MKEFECSFRLDAPSGSRGDSRSRLYRLGGFPTLTLWQMGGTGDISSLLARHKPCIVVDEDGGELLLSLPFAESCLIFPSCGDRLRRGCDPIPSRHGEFTTKRDSI